MIETENVATSTSAVVNYALRIPMAAIGAPMDTSNNNSNNNNISLALDSTFRRPQPISCFGSVTSHQPQRQGNGTEDTNK